MGGLRHGRPEELQAGRRIVEKIPHDHGRTVRRADFFQRLLRAAPYGITGRRGILRPLGDHFRLAHCGDRGKCLSPEPEGQDMGKILRLRKLARRVGKKSAADFIRCDTAAVVRNAKHGAAAFPYLNGHGARAGVDRVFHEFLHDGGRPLDTFARRDPVDRLF